MTKTTQQTRAALLRPLAIAVRDAALAGDGEATKAAADALFADGSIGQVLLNETDRVGGILRDIADLDSDLRCEPDIADLDPEAVAATLDNIAAESRALLRILNAR
jgi:hypothetical protein